MKKPNKPMATATYTAPIKTPTTNLMLPDPSKDNVTHINVHYTFAKTSLGRQLSTYQSAAFEHPYFGPFKCIEGFMRYVSTGCRDDSFRRMTGSQSKSHFVTSITDGLLVKYPIPNEAAILTSALYAKLKHNPVIEVSFTESTLPFDLYFLYKPSGLPIRPEDGALLTDSLTALRDLMVQGKEPAPIDPEEYAKLIVR